MTFYPWRFTGPLSYMRRPLLRIEARGGSEVLWGNRHVYESGKYLLTIVMEGRLQAKSQKMRDYVACVRRQEAALFNERIAALFRSQPGLVVASRVAKIGHMRIATPEGELGDIDVLVASPRRHRLLLVECKDLALARNPREYAHDLETLFRGHAGSASTVAKHQRRVEWVRDYLEQVLGQFGIKLRGPWHIEGLIVLSDDSFSRHLFRSPIPVLSFDQLVRDYIVQWAR